MKAQYKYLFLFLLLVSASNLTMAAGQRVYWINQNQLEIANADGSLPHMVFLGQIAINTSATRISISPTLNFYDSGNYYTLSPAEFLDESGIPWGNSVISAYTAFKASAPSGGGSGGATSFAGLSGRATPSQIGSGTPSAGYYVDGATGAWTALPAGGSNLTLSTQSQATVGTDNLTYMSPLRTAQAIANSLTGYLNTTGNDGRYLQKLNNLADLTNVGTARANLGLGSSSLLNAPASGNAATGEVVKGNDTRLSDSRTPTTHTHPLGDLTQSGATSGQVPSWNGTNWVPATPASGGGAPADTNTYATKNYVDPKFASKLNTSTYNTNRTVDQNATAAAQIAANNAQTTANNRQAQVTLTTTGSGAATFNQGTGALNIPAAGGGTIDGALSTTSTNAVSNSAVSQPIINNTTRVRRPIGLNMNLPVAVSRFGGYNSGYFTTSSATSVTYKYSFTPTTSFFGARFTFGNWELSSDGVIANGTTNPITVRFSFYPALQRGTFIGADSVRINPGATVVSDPFNQIFYAGTAYFLYINVSVAASGQKWPLGIYQLGVREMKERQTVILRPPMAAIR